MSYSNSLENARNVVRRRDKNTCRKCLFRWQKGERKFDVHHLDLEMEGKKDAKYDRDNNDKLITLCHRCHMRVHKYLRGKLTKPWLVKEVVVFLEGLG